MDQIRVRNKHLDEPPLANLAATCHLEESASHHILDPFEGRDDLTETQTV